MTSTVVPTRREWAAPAATVGLFAVVFGMPVANSIRLARGGSVSVPTGWPDQVAAVEGSVFAAIVVLVVTCRWLPRRAPDVTGRMGLRAVSTARTSAGVLTYFAIAATSTTIGSLLPDAAVASPIPSGIGGRIVGVAAAVSAGITEELVLLALPTAVLAVALCERPRLVLPITLVVLVLLRWSIHLQHGWAGLFVLLWVPAAYALFRRVGSIWPLVIGHALYDVVLVLTS